MKSETLLLKRLAVDMEGIKKELGEIRSILEDKR
jgi:hypothetical protein